MIFEAVHQFLLSLDAEKAHNIGKKLMRVPFLSPGRYITPKSEVKIFGFKLDNSLGLAAGFDKNGELVNSAHNHGFGWTEIGSVTYMGGQGNQQPRLFRLKEERSLLNRMGLNGDPAEVVAQRLKRYNSSRFAVNIAKTHNPEIIGDKAIEDVRQSYILLKNLGIYTVLNLSCPNTAEGKTFEDPKCLEELLSAVTRTGRGRPLLVKLSPDLTEKDLDKMMEVAEGKVQGYVCTNTFPSVTFSDQKYFATYGKGGISGGLIKTSSLSAIANVKKRTNKVIIGVGGLETGADAYSMKKQGADLYQAYSGFVYGGRDFAHNVNNELAELDRKDEKCI